MARIKHKIIDLNTTEGRTAHDFVHQGFLAGVTDNSRALICVGRYGTNKTTLKQLLAKS